MKKSVCYFIIIIILVIRTFHVCLLAQQVLKKCTILVGNPHNSGELIIIHTQKRKWARE